MSWLISKALLDSYENSRCSQGQAVESLEVNSLAGEPSALLNVMHTQHPFSHRDKMTVAWNRSPFGAMYAPLTESRGADLLTWYREGFPVRTSQQQEREQESTEDVADSGEKWRVSFARWDHASCSWKTPHCLPLAGLDGFLETWPRWGLMLNGECLELPTWERTTEENESGFWPTPDTCAGGTGPSQIGRNQPRLQDAVKMWATPCARDWKEQTLSPAIASTHNKPGKSQQLTRQMSAECPELHGGTLNPNWVEWLMGWPVGWTALEPLETGKLASWLQAHSGFFQEGKEMSPEEMAAMGVTEGDRERMGKGNRRRIVNSVGITPNNLS